MSLITLTTDLGLRDHYAASIKGAILSRAPGAVLVDISHNVSNFDIVQAAYIFKNCWSNFPSGALHLISVNDLGASSRRFLLLPYKGHFFVAPDNGLLPLIHDKADLECYELPWPDDHPFPIREVFASVAARLAAGELPEALGPKVSQIRQRLILQPVISKSQIRGTVIYIDQYDNVVVNVSRDLFETVGKDRSFALFFKRHDPITELSSAYADRPVGEPLCLFNSAGMLEIAIHMGKAASLLGLKIDDSIQIDFKDL